jgi:predicted enzyme related to lactoylglutathione lyase
MRIGEVCLLTNDVKRLANFYKRLLRVENSSDDPVHQFILTEETMLTVYNDGTVENTNNRNISIAFTVEDLDAEHERLIAMGTQIIEGPMVRPWGARNLSFCDPDGNVVYFRSAL